LCAQVTKEVLGEAGGHAGLDETYMVMAAEPELVKKELFSEDDVHLVRDGAYSYPNGGTLLLYEKGEGLPRFDPNEAKRYADAVVEEVANYVEGVLAGWKHGGV
jgi:creatinine amidohydrolase/Fe(II)-dependent formamide hydrolase-like protein